LMCRHLSCCPISIDAPPRTPRTVPSPV
jgi:hypothetical protein